MKKRETIALVVRMPLDMRAWLERRIERSTTSLSAETVRALRDVMDREQEQSRQHKHKAAAS